MVIVRTFGDAFVSHELEREAWRELSREFKWTEELINKYRANIDWFELSKNNEMLWTISILENFKEWIHWDLLSEFAPERILTPKIIRQFADKWDWGELSGNCCLKLSTELLDEFANKWDWERIINNWRAEEMYTPEFFERYKEFIPAERIKASALWEELVDRRVAELKQAIIEQTGA